MGGWIELPPAPNYMLQQTGPTGIRFLARHQV
jgi:hypothetical protein